MSDEPDVSRPDGAAARRPHGEDAAAGPGAREEGMLVVLAGGERFALPLDMVRRIERARILWMPRDPALVPGLADAVMGMIAIQGVVHGVLSLARLVGREPVRGEGARVIGLAPECLAVLAPGRLRRPGLALMVDGVIDVMSCDRGGSGMVVDLAALLASARNDRDAAPDAP